MLLGTPEAAQKTAEKLVDISAFYGFDGWLINVENKLSPPLYQHFSLFLSTLTKLSHEKVRIYCSFKLRPSSRSSIKSPYSNVTVWT